MEQYGQWNTNQIINITIMIIKLTFLLFQTFNIVVEPHGIRLEDSKFCKHLHLSPC